MRTLRICTRTYGEYVGRRKCRRVRGCSRAPLDGTLKRKNPRGALPASTDARFVLRPLVSNARRRVVYMLSIATAVVCRAAATGVTQQTEIDDRLHCLVTRVTRYLT